MQKIPLRNLCIGIFVGLLGSVIIFKDLIISYPNQVLWADNFDSRLIYWIVNWGYHIIFEQHNPSAFWNANSFYPHNITLAYSDSMLSIQLFFAPLRLIGVSPLWALYLSLFLVTIIGTILTAVGLSCTGYFTPIEILVITFASHFGLNFICFLYHYQLFGFHIYPSFFIFLYLFLRDLKFRYLFTTLLLYSFGVLFAVYLAPMLLVLAIIISIPIIIVKIKHFGIIKLLSKIGVKSFAIAALIACFLYFIQFRAYFKVAEKFPPQSLKEVVIYSANLNSIYSDFSFFSYWYRPMNNQSYGTWEYSYFPGYVLLGLSISFIIFNLFSIIRKRLNREIIENNAFLGYMFLLLITSIILSWGPMYKYNNNIKLPYYYISRIMIGLESIRAPGRFGMFIGLPLSIFSISIIKIVIKKEYVRRIGGLVLFIAIVIEAFPKFPVYPFRIENESLYKKVAKEITPGTPILELPVFNGDHMSTIRNVMDQLDGSTIHWGRLIVGYGSKTTHQYEKLLLLDNMVQNEKYLPIEIIKFAKRQKIPYILIHLDKYSKSVASNWINEFQNLGTKINYITEEDILVLLK